MKNYASLLLLCACLTAHAGPFTLLELPITFSAEREENISHGQECKVDEMLLNRLGQALHTNPPRDDTPPLPAEVSAPLGDARLRVTITHALRVEGFSMSGHRYLGIQADIAEKDKPARQTKFMRMCNVSGMGAFSKCNIFELCADYVALDLLRWSKNKQYRVKAGPQLKDIGTVAGAAAEKPADSTENR